ncbi:hypothetical protein L3Q82_006052 [Scortum barcoo]|uniref:Uncharacterized protein n=1 Tax=Scortum barcoo TaxID=214431 RepID=A0ACB8X289_9TELE|nr:hypothetical protein L3Q82_006052 [Scortum barcoo]
MAGDRPPCLGSVPAMLRSRLTGASRPGVPVLYRTSRHRPPPPLQGEDHIISKLPHLDHSFDPLQFAYRPKPLHRGCHLLRSSPEPDTPGGEEHACAECLFLDFSSAFNTIIPQHLVGKLGLLGFSTPLCNWLLDFLTERPQSVRVSKNTSSVITLSTGSHRGCVLSPLLFTLMTHDCVPRSATNHIVKFADDTTVVGLIRDDNDLAYRPREEVEQLVRCCEGNNLILNVDDKTKEIIVDFRKIQPSHAPLLINNSAVEVVSSTKFLGVHITDDLTWSVNSASLVKRAQQRLHFLRRMKRAHLPPPILTTFYRSTVESILTSCISVWCGGCTAADWRTVRRVVFNSGRTSWKRTSTLLLRWCCTPSLSFAGKWRLNDLEVHNLSSGFKESTCHCSVRSSHLSCGGGGGGDDGGGGGGGGGRRCGRAAMARTSASRPSRPSARLTCPLLRVEEEEEEAVEEVVVVVEEVPWMARFIQCSMLMLPSRLDEVPPPPPPSSSSPSPPSSFPSPWPSPSEPEEDNNLQLNVSKTKELIVDFRRRPREEHAPLPLHQRQPRWRESTASGSSGSTSVRTSPGLITLTLSQSQPDSGSSSSAGCGGSTWTPRILCSFYR